MDNITGDQKKVMEGFVGQQMIVLPPDIEKNIQKDAFIKGLYLTAIGYYPRATFHDRKRENGSPQYILLYCIDGNGYINIKGQKHTLIPNSYFIIPKDVPHHYGTSLSEPWSIYWIHFTGDHADMLYTRHLRGNVHETQTVPYDEQRIKLFNLIFSILGNSYNLKNMELVHIKSLQFLSSFIYPEEIYTSHYAVDQIDSSIKFMKENLDCCYSISELAARLNYSVSHYSDLFKRKTGFSPIQYFNQLKIQKSCQYLYFTDLNIKEICNQVGFEDPYYFSKIFKKLMGLSPAKYRSSYKK